MPLQHSHEHEEQTALGRTTTPPLEAVAVIQQGAISEVVEVVEAVEVVPSMTAAAIETIHASTGHPISLMVRGPVWYLLAMSATLPWLFINDPAMQWFYLYLPLALAFGAGFLKKPFAAERGLCFGLAGLLSLAVNGLVHHWAAPGMDVFWFILTLWVGGGTLAGVMGKAARHNFDKMRAQDAPPA